tara:strand:- start:705 stop:908 length:204 start_codon:yes stop_codon:yes gene_type:complete
MDNKPKTIKEFIRKYKNNDKDSLDEAYNKLFPEFRKKKENKKKKEDIFDKNLIKQKKNKNMKKKNIK